LSRKTAVLGIIGLVVLGLDIITKQWALATLTPGRSIYPLGEWMPITLAFNRGAAFGLRIGDDPRLVFIPITIVALVILASLYRHAEETDWLRLLSVSLVMSGAVGNLIDRVRWDRGVVDFLGPVDLGFMDWPIFNVADMAITCGAFLLAISFWFEEEPETETATEAGGGGSADGAADGSSDAEPTSDLSGAPSEA
jgi:signal peptidase II